MGSGENGRIYQQTFDKEGFTYDIEVTPRHSQKYLPLSHSILESIAQARKRVKDPGKKVTATHLAIIQGLALHELSLLTTLMNMSWPQIERPNQSYRYEPNRLDILPRYLENLGHALASIPTAGPLARTYLDVLSNQRLALPRPNDRHDNEKARRECYHIIATDLIGRLEHSSPLIGQRTLRAFMEWSDRSDLLPFPRPVKLARAWNSKKMGDSIQSKVDTLFDFHNAITPYIWDTDRHRSRSLVMEVRATSPIHEYDVLFNSRFDGVAKSRNRVVITDLKSGYPYIPENGLDKLAFVASIWLEGLLAARLPDDIPLRGAACNVKNIMRPLPAATAVEVYYIGLPKSGPVKVPVHQITGDIWHGKGFHAQKQEFERLLAHIEANQVRLEPILHYKNGNKLYPDWVVLSPNDFVA